MTRIQEVNDILVIDLEVAARNREGHLLLGLLLRDSLDLLKDVLQDTRNKTAEFTLVLL